MSLTPSGERIAVPADAAALLLVQEVWRDSVPFDGGEEPVPRIGAPGQDHVAGRRIPADENLFRIEPEGGWQAYRLTASVDEEFGDLADGGLPRMGYAMTIP